MLNSVQVSNWTDRQTDRPAGCRTDHGRTAS